MKVIYYRALIKGTNKLTPDEKILYSFLVSKSITDCNDLFNSDGLTINKDALYDCDDYIELKEMNNSKISRELGITRQSFSPCSTSGNLRRFRMSSRQCRKWLKLGRS